MSMLKVFNAKGESAGEFELADSLLEVKKGAQAVHDVVVAYQAGLRAGTASTKGKGAVAGSNKKPWRQKGTGQARSGYRRSPVWRGGGIAHGPHPRSFEQRLPKAIARLAFRRAMSDKIVAGDVKVVDALTLEQPKTKVFAGVLKSLGVGPKALVIVERIEPALALASRNLAGIELAVARDVSTVQVVRHSVVVATRSAMDALKARLSGGAGRAA